MKTISIYGLGYIGLPTAALLACNKARVKGVDVNLETVESVNSGKSSILETGIDELLKKAVNSGFLTAHKEGMEADVFIIAVPTPVERVNKKPTPSIKFIKKACEEISKYIKPGNLVILESTSPIGTTREIMNLISNASGIDKEKLLFCYCPERVIPGNTIKELVGNHRIIGAVNESSFKAAEEVYSIFCKGEMIKTNDKTAEISKLTENSFRDVNIAFSNEISILCDSLDIDVWELISLTNLHPRVNLLNPGCGVGGHCIAVDPWFLVADFPKETKLIQTSRKINDNKTEWVFNRVCNEINQLKNKLNRDPKVGCFGITYKPDTDDLRESPALKIVNKLSKIYDDILICEPNIDSYKKLKIYKTDYILKNSDLLIFLVSHKEFRKIQTHNKKVMDFCGLFKT